MREPARAGSLSRALVGSVLAVVAQWRRRRCLVRTTAALRGLSEATLRDIGVMDPEIVSLAAEVHGLAETTR